MDWQADGFILSVRKHGETSAIIHVLTQEYGLYAGLVRGGIGRRMRPVLQAGNKVQLEWRARLSEHLGYFTVEALDSGLARGSQCGLRYSLRVVARAGVASKSL